jgi:lipoprotein-anchoring transpeptidase ErfK/SrfK
VNALNRFSFRLLALVSLSALAACAPKAKVEDPAKLASVPGYEGVQDGAYFIPPVDPRLLEEDRAKTEVAYNGPEAPGTVVVDTFARKLYLVGDGGKATRYAIAVGREGLSFRGSGYIGRKAEWPSWQPTANMVRTRPDLYAEYAGGRAGGLDNPLGARAMYLYRGGRDTMFRIHGTIQNESIGHATSAGCIRLFNQDAIDLYNKIPTGTHVKVRSLEESIAIEGPYTDDAYGRAVPDTPENAAKKVEDEKLMAEQAAQKAENERIAAAKAAEEAAKADKKRLRACKRQGIAPEDCPPLPEATAEAATASAG